MPQLYRDAVILTRKLDIQYLWIDAPCIIRDSKAHWTKESARMSDIFANSLLIIASQSTHDVHEGFGRKPIADVPSWTTGILSNHSDTPLPLSSRRSLPFSHDPRLYQKTKHDHDFGVHILDLRAWTLQEALLSSRYLRTNSEQMVWTCDQTFFRESSDEPVFHDNFNSSGPAFAKEINTETNLSPRWRQMIQMYSDREMSYEIDKLPASAHNHHNLSQEKYLVGVWFSDLHRQLLWCLQSGRIQSSETTLQAPRQYCAPPFSWASLNGPITAYLASYEKRFPGMRATPITMIRSMLEKLRSSRQIQH